MTSLGLVKTGGALIAEDTAAHLFETPSRRERYRPSRWPYAYSALLHAVALIAVVRLAWSITPPPPPAPALRVQQVDSVFVLPTFAVDRSLIQRRPTRPPRSRPVPAAIARDVAAAPVPAALGDSGVVVTRPIVDETPAKSAFDPPIPAGDASLRGRRGDPSEAGLGSASLNARASSAATGEIRPGGLGEGRIPGFDDGTAGGGGGGMTPPRIQEPLPVPDYPADARSRRLQGVVVLEVMLDAVGKAHVRGVRSRPLGFGIEEAARNAAERLRFTPARQGGRSVDAIVQVRVTFTLTDGVATAVTGGA